jgi:hypothetical protein
MSYVKAIFIYQAMTLTKDSVLWNGLPQSGNITSPTFSEKIRNPLNLSLYLHLSNMSDLILRQFKNQWRLVRVGKVGTAYPDFAKDINLFKLKFINKYNLITLKCNF